MKSIREAAALVQILNLIQDRSYDILCDIVDAVMFNTGSIQSVLDKWGIKVNIEDPAMTRDTVNINNNGRLMNFTIKQYNAIITHILQGRLIEAIKDVRAATGYGLKEAKDFVEMIRDKM